MPRHVWQVISLVCEHYFVQALGIYVDDPLGGHERVRAFELYGRPENLDLAEYVFHFLIEQGEVAYQRHRAAGHGGGVRARNSFFCGLYRGFAERLQREQRHLADEHALVWRGDPQLEAFIRDRYPRVNVQRFRRVLDRSALEAGEAAGRELQLRPALKRQVDGFAGLLS